MLSGWNSSVLIKCGVVATFYISLLACETKPSTSYATCRDVQIVDRGFCTVSFIELLGNPDALNGIDISISGHVIVENGIAFLLPTIEDAKNENDEVAILLDVSPEFIARYENRIGYISIYGRFEWHPESRNPGRREISKIVEHQE